MFQLLRPLPKPLGVSSNGQLLARNEVYLRPDSNLNNYASRSSLSKHLFHYTMTGAFHGLNRTCQLKILLSEVCMLFFSSNLCENGPLIPYGFCLSCQLNSVKFLSIRHLKRKTRSN